jgi:hydrogenase small subunit
MLSLDYHVTLMAAAGHQAEKQLEEIKKKYKGNYILAVEGNPPLNEDGMFCIEGGRPFVEILKETAADAKAVIAWGACASWGCVQAAKPNPTRATPIDKVISGKPIVKVPGCPPIAEVMTGVVTYMLTFDRIPELDRQGRPKMFYGQRIHDKCYRRPHFDAGQFVEHWDDDAARKGYCLYKMGCKGPTTYNACSTVRWNDGVSFPIQSGHGCIGCSEDGFWDKGSFYDRVTDIKQFGVEANADKVGGTAAAVVGGAVVAHAAVSALARARNQTGIDVPKEGDK